ncbi:tail fiber domain-containing protein [Pseudomonas sp. HR96]|uniref:tail fiber domain-containing protein n=1 Tax=Pseudomonas sp. HR96 TaxID=1027966 RepID=UPI002A76255F|nr:tail fiber domain-containing protein [Pseudomonas sp. HR96]WPO97901.1 tail fiber domain-containing protein [Pseudomonas sp. HR96]
MNVLPFISGAIGTASIVFAAAAFAEAPVPLAPLANNGGPGFCPPNAPNCPGFGDIGAECCPFSDESLKTNVVPLKSATEQLLKIHGVTFEWKDGARKDIGVVAQDVAKVYPQLTRTQDGLMQVDYNKLVAPLIESVRELNARIEALEAAKPSVNAK